MWGVKDPIRVGDRVRLDSIVGVVLRVQSPNYMLKVHGKVDHPGLYLVKWDKGGEFWYLAEHLVAVGSVACMLDRIRSGFRWIF